MRHARKDERQCWLWVTHPEYYLDEDGRDREDLDPTAGGDTSGWWTCHRDTKQGDLVLLWRTSPKKDIGYLIQTESDAYSIVDDRYASSKGWEYGCDYRVLWKFERPVTIEDLHDSIDTHEWGAYRGRFQRRVFRIPGQIWSRLNTLAEQKNPDYGKFRRQVERERVFGPILLETQLEEILVRNLAVLKPFGYELELYVDPATGSNGRQFVCRGNGGRIDLLCHDRRRRQFVVIELKNVRATRKTIGQILSYVGWVQTELAKRRPVVGLVISRGYDAKFASALSVADRISTHTKMPRSSRRWPGAWRTMLGCGCGWTSGC